MKERGLAWQIWIANRARTVEVMLESFILFEDFNWVA